MLSPGRGESLVGLCVELKGAKSSEPQRRETHLNLMVETQQIPHREDTEQAPRGEGITEQAPRGETLSRFPNRRRRYSTGSHVGAGFRYNVASHGDNAEGAPMEVGGNHRRLP